MRRREQRVAVVRRPVALARKSATTTNVYTRGFPASRAPPLARAAATSFAETGRRSGRSTLATLAGPAALPGGFRFTSCFADLDGGRSGARRAAPEAATAAETAQHNGLTLAAAGEAAYGPTSLVVFNRTGSELKGSLKVKTLRMGSPLGPTDRPHSVEASNWQWAAADVERPKALFPEGAVGTPMNPGRRATSPLVTIRNAERRRR